MARNKSNPHLVSYDIRCPRRLGRVFRHLKKAGIHIQYSVFLLEINQQQLNKLLAELDAIIAQEDDIRIYALPTQPFWCTFGRSTLADGIVLNGPLDFAVGHKNK